MTPSIKDLPFDQYSRQKIVANFIDALRQNDQKLKILDVGGYKGKTKEFLPKDRIATLDVFEIKEEGYIKGDGTNLKFGDQTFDFVVSFDVLEHIPKERRQKFILEGSRVAKIGFFLCCPFDDGSSTNTNAEKALDGIYKELKSVDHPWLKEHLDNGLPIISEIETYLAKANLNFTKTYSNLLKNWLAIQMVIFFSDALDVTSIEAGHINRLYNNNAEELDVGANGQSAYRVIYFISKDETAVNKIDQAINKSKTSRKISQESLLDKVVIALTEIVNKRVKADQHKVTELEEALAQKTKDIEVLHENITSIEQSLSWKITKPLREVKRSIDSR